MTDHGINVKMAITKILHLFFQILNSLLILVVHWMNVTLYAHQFVNIAIKVAIFLSQP
jgi:IS4 transposase